MLRISTLTKALNLFGIGKHGFQDGDMATSTPPTDFDAKWCNGMQEEIMSVIEAAGIIPSDASYAQLLEAIKRMIDIQAGNYALDTGAANAYVIALDPVIEAYTDGMTVRVRFANTNTGASTLDAGPGAKALCNDVGGALQPGDAPAGGVASATFDAALDKWLINSLVPSQAMSQAAADARYDQGMFPFNATTTTNALTGTLAACFTKWRNPDAAVGTPVSVLTSASLSLTIPATSNLGAPVSGQSNRLYWVEYYNGGNPVLGVINSTGSAQLDERQLVSPTTIGAASNSANVFYSASAVGANSPYRVTGSVDAVFTTGTGWSAPSAVQPAGGLALAAIGSLGYGQSWQDVKTTPGRVNNTTYYNTTGKSIEVKISTIDASGGILFYVNGSITQSAGSGATGGNFVVGGVIPPGGSYKVVSNGAINYWQELR